MVESTQDPAFPLRPGALRSAWGIVFVTGILACAVIFFLGVFWSATRGGDDFRVFYHAWHLVLAGRGADIYRDSPDRFLYAPGFAWLLSPLAALPFGVALGIWSVLKIATVSLIARECAIQLSGQDPAGSRRPLSLPAAGLAAWAVALVARPVLVDFEYGQVNILILGACFWALVRYCGRKSPSYVDFVSWALLGVAGVTKLFPLPLFLVPILVLPTSKESSLKRRAISIAGLAVGMLVTLLLPLVSEGAAGLLSLYPQWKLALLDRGLPLESHNQSFAAFLHHFLSGEATQIIAQHRRAIVFGFPLLSSMQIELLAAAWALAILSCVVGLISGWEMDQARRPGRFDAFYRGALLLALLIVPSHLVWKPYFCFGLPVAVVALFRAATRSSRLRWALVALAFVAMNLTGFDFVGQEWGARLESASLMLWAHLTFCLAAI